MVEPPMTFGFEPHRSCCDAWPRRLTCLFSHRDNLTLAKKNGYIESRREQVRLQEDLSMKERRS